MKSEIYHQVTRLLTDGKKAEAVSVLSANRNVISEMEWLECMGNMYFYDKMQQEAVDYYESAMTMDEQYDCARYHYLIGVREERAERYEDAFLRYQAAIEIEPDFVDAYVELGGLLWKVEDFEGAYTCYRDALKLDRSQLANFYNLAQVLSELAKINPSKYSDLLENARTEYLQARLFLPDPASNHSW